MKLVAFAELAIFLRVALGAFFLQNSLLAPIVYAHFLRMRYYQSVFTQRAAFTVIAYIDAFVRKPGNPPIVVSIWDKVQLVVSRWVGSVIQQQPAATPGADR